MLYRAVFLLDKYADSRDGRFLARVLRYTAFLRGALPTAQLRAAVDMYVPDAGRRAVVQALVTAAAERRPEPVAAAPAVVPVSGFTVWLAHTRCAGAGVVPRVGIKDRKSVV